MAATNAVSLLKQSVTNPTVQAAANADQNAGAPASSSSGIPGLPSFDLASFLGLPTVIDWQDLGIRVGLVVTGILLLVLVAWSFVRGKQQTTVNVQVPAGATQAAEEVA